MKHTPEYQAAKKRAFLEAFALMGIVRHACESVPVDRTTVWDWRQDDPVFAADFKKAQEDAADRLEAEAFRRAHDGVERYVTNNKGVVYLDGQPLVERVYSDSLMQTLLRAHRPERFRERSSVDLSVKKDPSSMTDEELAAIASRSGKNTAEPEDGAS